MYVKLCVWDVQWNSEGHFLVLSGLVVKRSNAGNPPWQHVDDQHQNSHKTNSTKMCLKVYGEMSTSTFRWDREASEYDANSLSPCVFWNPGLTVTYQPWTIQTYSCIFPDMANVPSIMLDFKAAGLPAKAYFLSTKWTLEKKNVFPSTTHFPWRLPNDIPYKCQTKIIPGAPLFCAAAAPAIWISWTDFPSPLALPWSSAKLMVLTLKLRENESSQLSSEPGISMQGRNFENMYVKYTNIWTRKPTKWVSCLMA